MSSSSWTPTCNFVSPPFQSGDKMLLLHHQYLIEKKERETFPHIEYPSTKRARTGENFVHNRRMLMNEVMSSNFQTKLGHYTYGDQCLFTHGAKNNHEQSTGTWNGEDRLFDEVQLCRMFYYQKTCKYGDRCRYLHVNPERVKEVISQFKDRPMVSSYKTGGSSGSKRSRSGRWEQKGFVKSRSFCDQVNQKPMWKTKPCRNWDMTGSCLYGKICYFAHGQAELRHIGSHNALEPRIVPENTSNIVSTINDQTRTTTKQQLHGMKSIFKGKELKKISGIYADWVDNTGRAPSDLLLLHTYPNKVEN